MVPSRTTGHPTGEKVPLTPEKSNSPERAEPTQVPTGDLAAIHNRIEKALRTGEPVTFSDNEGTAATFQPAEGGAEISVHAESEEYTGGGNREAFEQYVADQNLQPANEGSAATPNQEEVSRHEAQPQHLAA